MKKIMIIEDDENIFQVIEKNLLAWGYEVETVKDFECVMDYFNAPDLVIIDIKLPYYDGYHWLRKIREVSDCPIIFLSSKDESLNIIMAIDQGADDYITKPFDMEILLAKIRAILRRRNANEKDELIYGEYRLSLLDMKFFYRDQALDLSKNEFKILEILLRERGNIVKREDLMNRLWQSDEYIDDNTLTVNVARLRKRLEDIGIKDLIKTKVGVGYYAKSED